MILNVISNSFKQFMKFLLLPIIQNTYPIKPLVMKKRKYQKAIDKENELFEFDPPGFF